MGKYIGYFYEYDKNGEMIDDFKEWTNASSENEARNNFDDDYPSCSSRSGCKTNHGTTIRLDFVSKES